MLQPSEWTRRKIISAMCGISATKKRQELVSKLLDVSARLRRAELNRELLQEADVLVQSGPFRGMRLSLEASWRALSGQLCRGRRPAVGCEDVSDLVSP